MLIQEFKFNSMKTDKINLLFKLLLLLI